MKRFLDRGAAMLKWQVQTETMWRWHRLAWLVQMLQGFGLIAPSGADPLPVEEVK